MSDSIDVQRRVIDRCELNDRGCWIFTGAKTPNGYGAVRHLGLFYYTHRLAWEGFNGPIAEGLHVLHKCDNPSCCNPDHLFLGTPKANSDDKVSKNRQARPGKLLNGQVISLRKVAAMRLFNQSEIAIEFGLCQSQVSRIINGNRWSQQ